MTLGGTIFAAIPATAAGTDTPSNFATGNVTAHREGNGPYQLKFSAGGTPTNAHGTVTYQEPAGYTFSGKVTCYHQEGGRAVFTGPVTKEANPDNNTVSFVVWVTDNDPFLGQDAFDVAGGANLGPGCATDFPLDRFDDEEAQESHYYLDRGNIIVGNENAQ
jgi:hypothetical protein